MSTRERTPHPAPRNRAERRAVDRGRRPRAAGAALTAGSAALAATAAIAGPGALPAGAAAQTFTVSSTADAGPNTLRQAILDANANPGDDTIVFTGAAAGPGAAITLTTGELAVTDNLDVQGPGSAALSVSGNDASRVFYLSGPARVSISGLTVTNGSAGGDGGAIASAATDLVLDDVVVADSQSAGAGGGVNFVGAGESLTIRNSVVTGNTTVNGDGGGVHTDAAGPVTIEDSRFTANTADDDGGGIEIETSTEATITNSTISDNTAGEGGGGLYADDVSGALTFSGLTVTGNSAGEGGGGLSWFDVDGAVTLSQSLISGNQASHGGGLYFDGDHGVSTTIEFSTISGNSTDDGDGGGLYAEAFTGALVVRNSTISGNSASDDGGGFQLTNFYEGASASILNSTITGNTAAEHGGAGAAYYVAALDLVQSTITGNTAESVGGLYLYGDVSDVAARAADGGDGSDHGGSDGGERERKVHDRALGDGSNNLVGTILAGNSGIDLGSQGTVVSDHSILGVVGPGIVVTDAGGTQFGVDPGLGALAANGGATETMALLTGSPARDAGPLPEPAFPGSDSDQRGAGFARVVDGRADVGAFEVQVAAVPTPQPLVITPKFTG